MRCIFELKATICFVTKKTAFIRRRLELILLSQNLAQR